jgi:hypothetical protein
MPIIQGHSVKFFAPQVEGSRAFSYQIDDEKVVEVDCPDMTDLTRIVTRVIAAMDDPSKLVEKPEKIAGTAKAPKPEVDGPTPSHPAGRRGITPDGKPSEL